MTSKVRQLAKKMESSKSTTRHIKAVASDPKAAQGNLIRHQRIDLPSSKSKWKQYSNKSKSKRDTQVNTRIKDHPLRKCLIQAKHTKEETDVQSVVIESTLKVSGVLLGRSSARPAVNMVIFTSLCYKKQSSFKSRNPKAHQLQAGLVYVQEDSISSQSSDLTSSNESFCLQVKIQCTQANTKFPTPHHLITKLAYRLKPHYKRNEYLRSKLDTCANVNIMPASVYNLVLHDPDCEKLAPRKLETGTYTTDKVKVVGSCQFYLVHPDTKCLQEVTFYVASNNGSVLLSCMTTLAHALIQPHTSLDYLPPTASLITSSADHPKKTKSQISVRVSKKESEVSNHKGMASKLITSEEQILSNYSDVLMVLDAFLVPDTIFRSILVSHAHKPLSTNPCTSQRVFQERDWQDVTSRSFETCKPSNSWINSVLLVEGKGKFWNLPRPNQSEQSHCMWATSLHDPRKYSPFACRSLCYHCMWLQKGYWHQQLDEASSFLTTFNTEWGRFWYTVVPFGATVAGDVFHRKLDECFGKQKQAIIITDDIMVAGYKPDYSDHDLAFTSLLQTAQKCSDELNYGRLQYKQNEVDFFGETYTTSGCKPARSNMLDITAMPSPTNKKQVQLFIGMINYLPKFSPRLSEPADLIRELSKDKAPFNCGLEHQAAFTKMKQEISSAPVFAYYNPKKLTMLQADASIKRSWCLFITRWKACFFFASKALTEAQKGYVAIEIESLAVAWAMKKFHHFFMPVTLS